MDATGKPEQFVSVRYEITERKLAEEKLSLYAKKLELSNQELSDFASVAAHDLQEPLRKIQSFSDRLRVRAKQELQPESMDFLDRIQNSAHRMQVLINDLLTYSRVTTKAQPFLPVNLNQIVAQVVSDLEVRLEKTKGRVEWDALPTLDADPTQMYQLFQNLINNALKFSKPDVPPVVKLTALRKDSASLMMGSACEISVSDNGIGFDEKYLDRIFTIFQRLHGRHEYEGTGIGLAVCRKIVDRHGGLISARSKEGEGAQFLVTLPMKQKKAQEL
jgi:light-regulated signal transduction histidine kinase (bacteriophytochrome)